MPGSVSVPQPWVPKWLRARFTSCSISAFVGEIFAGSTASIHVPRTGLELAPALPYCVCVLIHGPWFTPLRKLSRYVRYWLLGTPNVLNPFAQSLPQYVI